MLSGALVLHSFSGKLIKLLETRLLFNYYLLAVIAFIGAFVLVGYKVKEAKDEAKEEGKSQQPRPSSGSGGSQQQLWSSNPHLAQGKCIVIISDFGGSQ
jgi:hypothetical protein